MKSGKKKLLSYFPKIIGFLILLVSILYLLMVLKSFDYSKVQQFSFSRIFSTVLICSLIYGLFFNLLPIAWVIALNLFSLEAKKVKLIELVKVYNNSNLMKYLPGNVMEFVGRNVFGIKYNIQQSHLTLATLLETALIAGVSILLGIFSSRKVFQASLERIYGYLNISSIIGYGLLGFACLILGVGLLFLGKHFKKKSIKRESFPSIFVISKSLLLIAGLHLIVFINLSSTLLIIIINFFDIQANFADFQIICSAFCLSWIVGFLTPGAPGGLGVKEASLVILLKGFYPMDICIVATFLHRLVSVFGDLLAAIFPYLLEKIFFERDSKSNS